MCGHSTGVIANDNKLRVSKWKSEIQDGGFKNSVAQFSANTHDSNEIPTIKPMFPGSGNTYKLLRIRFYIWAFWKSKTAAINQK